MRRVTILFASLLTLAGFTTTAHAANIGPATIKIRQFAAHGGAAVYRIDCDGGRQDVEVRLVGRQAASVAGFYPGKTCHITQARIDGPYHGTVTDPTVVTIRGIVHVRTHLIPN